MNDDPETDLRAARDSLAVRRFGRVDVGRTAWTLGVLAVVAVCYWILLPIVQSYLIPSAPGGRKGPWVLRPIMAFHFGAVAVLSAVTFPLILRPLNAVWIRQDAALGSRFDPLHNQPFARFRALLAGFLLLLVYASALVFYLFSWEVVGPDGIEERVPWGTRKHSYRDVVSLQTIPDGQRSDSLAKNGPWYDVRLRSGGSVNFCEDNEGITRDELTAIAAFIAERSGRPWQVRPDARAR